MCVKAGTVSLSRSARSLRWMDPRGSSLRCAAERAHRNLATVIVGALVIPVLGGIIGSSIDNGGLGALYAFLLVVLLAVFYAFVVAPMSNATRCGDCSVMLRLRSSYVTAS